jgi:hypothetical protein
MYKFFGPGCHSFDERPVLFDDDSMGGAAVEIKALY